MIIPSASPGLAKGYERLIKITYKKVTETVGSQLGIPATAVGGASGSAEYLATLEDRTVDSASSLPLFSCHDIKSFSHIALESEESSHLPLGTIQNIYLCLCFEGFWRNQYDSSSHSTRFPCNHYFITSTSETHRMARLPPSSTWNARHWSAESYGLSCVH